MGLSHQPATGVGAGPGLPRADLGQAAPSGPHTLPSCCTQLLRASAAHRPGPPWLHRLTQGWAGAPVPSTIVDSDRTACGSAIRPGPQPAEGLAEWTRTADAQKDRSQRWKWSGPPWRSCPVGGSDDPRGAAGPQGLRPLLPAFSPSSVLSSRPLITFLWGSTLCTPTCSDLCRHLAVLKGIWCAGP